MTLDVVSALEVILYTIMAIGGILASAGLWITFNQDKLTE